MAHDKGRTSPGRVAGTSSRFFGVATSTCAVSLLAAGLAPAPNAEASDAFFVAPEYPNENCIPEFTVGGVTNRLALPPQMVASTVGVPVPVSGTPAAQTLVVGQLNGIPAKSEIQGLLADCGLAAADWTVTDDPVVPPGPNDNQVEATLDLTVVAGLLPSNVTLKVVNSGGIQGELLLQQAAACGLDASADPSTWERSDLATPVGGCIITNSYGTTEQNVDTSLSTYQDTLDILEGLAQAGVIVLFSAGDEGSGGCTPDSVGRVNELAPQWLASHPDVLSVGGTMWVEEGWDGEPFNPYSVSYVPGTRYVNVAWQDTGAGSDCTNTPKGGTGGGVSGIYPIPAYQNAVQSVAPADKRGKRLVPDLAGLAGWPTWIVVVPNPAPTEAAVRGTSAATPLTAVGLAHVNAALTARGLSPLDNAGGSLDVHSVFYNNAFSSALTDVTEGSNDLFDLGGYSAQAGYDLTTGMGVPNFSTLAQLLIDAQTVTYDPQGPPPVLQQVPVPATGTCCSTGGGPCGS